MRVARHPPSPDSQPPNNIGDQRLGLAAGGAVADRNDLDVPLLSGFQQCLPGLVGLVQIDHAALQVLAGSVDHGNLAAGAIARVNAHDDPAAQRRLKE
jgi:hypothetical protein